MLYEKKRSRLSFFEFATKSSIPHCAVYSRCDDNFVISNSIGFDGETIVSSLKPVDFWEDKIKNKNWTFFSRDNASLSVIPRFFSMRLEEKINMAGTYYFENMILLAAYDEKKVPLNLFHEISENFKMVDFSIPNEILKTSNQGLSNQLLSFDYKNALTDFSTKHQTSSANAIAASNINNALRMELEYSLRNLSNENIDFTKNDTFEIGCNVHSKSNISAQALKSFLNLNLKPILNSSVNFISYDD